MFPRRVAAIAYRSTAPSGPVTAEAGLGWRQPGLRLCSRMDLADACLVRLAETHSDSVLLTRRLLGSATCAAGMGGRRFRR
jgi:hypothetical protein